MYLAQYICENKGTDQLISACFRYTDSTIPCLSKSKISSLQQSSVFVQLGLCQVGLVGNLNCWFNMFSCETLLSNYIWLFSCLQITVAITRPVGRWRYADLGRRIIIVNVRRDILVTQPSAVAYPLRNEI